MSNRIVVAREAGIHRLRLDRPDKVNALDTAMMHELAAAVQAASEARLIVISGAGQRGFCAGADIAEFVGGEKRLEAQDHGLRALIGALGQSPVPILSLIHGRAMGAGAMIAVLSDIVVAADDLALGFPEIRFNMYPAMMHAVLLERVSGALAWQLCASGRILSAGEARDIGIVTEVLPETDFTQAAEERIAFYAQRAASLLLGRGVAPVLDGQKLMARVEAAAPLMHENFRRPGVLETIVDYLGGLSKRQSR